MVRKVFSSLFYVLAGFFVYMISLLAFINLNAMPDVKNPPLWFKFKLIGFFSIPALIILGIGLAISGFRHWKRDAGIVLVSGAGTAAAVVFVVFCVLLSPESKQFFPAEKLDFLKDWITGGSCIGLLVLIGTALIVLSRRVDKPEPDPVSKG